MSNALAHTASSAIPVQTRLALSCGGLAKGRPDFPAAAGTQQIGSPIV